MSNRKMTKGTYTCNGVVDNSVTLSTKYYVDTRNYSAAVLFIGLLAIIGVVLLIVAVS